MDIKNKNKEELLKRLKQRLEDSWSGFTQVIEEAEEFYYDIESRIDDKLKEELEIFYEDYVDNLKFQAEGLQAETQQAIDKFEGMYNISYMKDEV
jgi:hypothetical protein|tara:strand:+ start:249 stop:533 length:285 start_codon:yes stop_codon:yes gene_type:complete